jgi:hypothetical protein
MSNAIQETSLKFSKSKKEIMALMLKKLNANFRWNLKQKDILNILVDFLIVDDSFSDLQQVKISLNTENVNDQKVTMIISVDVKQKFDLLIRKFRFVQVQTEGNDLILQSTPQTEYIHNLRNEEYIAIFLSIIQYKIKTKKAEDVSSLFQSIYDQYV